MMNLPDLNQAFYNLLSQFQAEQIYTADIDEATRSHADDLDGFSKVFQKLNGEVEGVSLQTNQYNMEHETNMVKLYERLKTENDEQHSHLRAGFDIDMKNFYNMITDDRNKHVVANENKLRDEIDAFVVKVENQVLELRKP